MFVWGRRVQIERYESPKADGCLRGGETSRSPVWLEQVTGDGIGEGPDTRSWKASETSEDRDFYSIHTVEALEGGGRF